MLVDKQSELMSDLLFTVHQRGGDDVTWKPPIPRGQFVSGHVARAKKWGLDKNPKKWEKSETSLAVVYKTKVSHFKVKNTPLKATDGKRKFKGMLCFLLLDKGRLFFTKLSFEEFKIFFTVESLACFEMQLSSEVFEESLVYLVLYSQENYVFKRKFMYL